MVGIIQSPDLGTTYTVAYNDKQLDIICPIEHTPLVEVHWRSGDFYHCYACRAKYAFLDKDKESLRLQAKKHLETLIHSKEKLANLDQLLTVAVNNGVIDLLL